MANKSSLPSPCRRVRCPDCGLRGLGPVCECHFHQQKSHESRSFNPRCCYCWSELWTGLIHSFFVCAWRVLRRAKP